MTRDPLDPEVPHRPLDFATTPVRPIGLPKGWKIVVAMNSLLAAGGILLAVNLAEKGAERDTAVQANRVEATYNACLQREDLKRDLRIVLTKRFGVPLSSLPRDRNGHLAFAAIDCRKYAARSISPGRNPRDP